MTWLGWAVVCWLAVGAAIGVNAVWLVRKTHPLGGALATLPFFACLGPLPALLFLGGLAWRAMRS